MKRMIKIVPILLILPSLCFSTISSGKPKKASPKSLFPEVVFEIQATNGSYSKEEIRVVADSSLLSLRTIYYKYLNKGLDFNGDVLLKFSIAKGGEITKVDILHSSTGNAEFDEAIKNKIAIWKLNIKSGNTVVTILFEFAILFPTHYHARKSFIISGVRSPKDINLKVISRAPELTNIGNKYLRLKPDLDGDIIVIFKFEIASSGEVTNVDILANTAEYAEFDEAIKSAVTNWKWEPIENGNTTVSVFWVFWKPEP